MEYTVWIDKVKEIFESELGQAKFDEDIWMEDYLDEKTPEQAYKDRFGG